MTKKSGWLLTALVILGVFIFQHQRVPNVPLPAQYTSAPAKLTLSAAMKVPPDTGFAWTLSRTSDGKVYVVSVFDNARLEHQYKTDTLISQNAQGKTFSTSGKIEFSGNLYNAKTIHVNPDGKTATILFVAAPAGKS
ncbi:MAG: hypothetical protein K6T83_13055 [Alicyclobacillus sp.]|nr:hypothetical protein [Alicyclobacillus sp.]